MEYTANAKAYKMKWAEYINSQTGRICHGLAYEIELWGNSARGGTWTAHKRIPASKGKAAVRDLAFTYGADTVEFIEGE